MPHLQLSLPQVCEQGAASRPQAACYSQQSHLFPGQMLMRHAQLFWHESTHRGFLWQQRQAPRLRANGSCLHSLLRMVQMAAAFALSALGVVLGTRLCATHESLLPEAKKQALVEAGYSSSCNPSTLHTTLYDELGTVPWPPEIDGQCLTNQFTAVYSGQTPLQVGLVLACSFCQHKSGDRLATQDLPTAGICVTPPRIPIFKSAAE